MRTSLTLAAIAAATVVILAAALPAQALPLQCSGTAVGVGPSEDTAEQAWSQQAAASYGGAWSNFSLAKNKQYSDTNLGLGTLWTVSAEPCRHFALVQPITAIGNLHVQQIDPPTGGTSPLHGVKTGVFGPSKFKLGN